MKILDDDGNELPAGEPGSIYIGSTRAETAEYFKDAEKSASIRRGSLVTLGDVGYFDDDGFLFLCDRKIDMVISGGVNIYPAEVEACLLAHDAVADVAVIGVPDDDWGESVKAIVETSAGVETGPRARRRAGRALPRADRPASSARAASTSSTCCPASPTARSRSGASASPTGPATNAPSDERGQGTSWESD